MGLRPEKEAQSPFPPVSFSGEHSDRSLSTSLELGGPDLQPPAVQMKQAQAGGQAPFSLWAAVVPA